ncbi:hypothetical protein PFISCL1PPCAC_17725, partial [Pristionchus fissidentatus]
VYRCVSREMRCFLLILLAALEPLITAQKCPTNYELMGDGRCIRASYFNQSTQIGVAIPAAIEDCKKDGAFLPIIRNDEENTMYNGIHAILSSTHSYGTLLGMICNSETRRLEWEDGSKVTYTKNNLDLGFDCVTKNYLVYSHTISDEWIACNTTTCGTTFAWLCVSESIDEQCGEYETMVNTKDEDEPCFKIYTEALSWRYAQARCEEDFGSLAKINSEEENKFFWRTAVANSVLNDMHIGAYQQNDNSDVWQWIDDNSFINGTAYNNFAGAFPIPGAGSCTTMLTENSNAKWINDDCSQLKLPFLCRRKSPVSLQCPEVAPKAGQDIFSPGFPRPSVQCEYLLVVDAGSVVQLDILLLETIPDVDVFEIYEGVAGGNLIANVTGTKPNPSSFTTKSSNVMRVNWIPDVVYRP